MPDLPVLTCPVSLSSRAQHGQRRSRLRHHHRKYRTSYCSRNVSSEGSATLPQRAAKGSATMSSSSTDRIALFIDGANLYATAKTLGFDIDYKRLLKQF